MPIGYDYRCDACDHQWLLFSTRQSLGPVQWGETKYTCFTCQTFLSVAKSVDRNSWKHWLANNTDTIGRNPVLRQLATSITDKLNATTGMTPLELTFESIECPTCNSGRLSTVPFGEHNMRCSKCGDYSGEFINTNGITIYAPPELNPKDAG